MGLHPSRRRTTANPKRTGNLGFTPKATGRALAAMLETLEPRQLLAGLDPYISEFLAENDDLMVIGTDGLPHAYVDQDGDRTDWIEIHNPKGTAINLQGWYLTDNPAKLDKWAFPSTIVPANDYVVVFASDKRRAIAGQELHTNFKLDNGGEYLALVRPDGSIASEYAPQYPPQTADVSYGQGAALITNTTLISPGQTASLLVPANDDLGTSWTHVGFDDSGWASAPSGLGFQHMSGASLPAEVEPNGGTGSANSAIYNFEPYSGNLYHLGLYGDLSTDYFKIGDLQAGDVLTVTVAGSTSRTSAYALDPAVALFRGTQTQLTVNSQVNDAGPGADGLIPRLAITQTGSHYVRVTRQTGSTRYDLGILLENAGAAPLTGQRMTQEVESNSDFSRANDLSQSWRPVQYRSSTQGTIASAAEVDVYAYQFHKGDLLSINIDSTSNLDAAVALLDPSGNLLASEDGTSEMPAPYDKDSWIIGYLVPNDGIYYVRVQSASGTGAYVANVYLSADIAPPVPGQWGNYDGKIAGNIGPLMKDASASVYLRMPIAAIDAATISALTLRVDYDDGFIAYLNGTPVAAQNAPPSPSHQSSATAAHQANGFVEFDISQYKNLLLAQDEANVLAIHGLNVSADDPDFLLVAELVATSVIPASGQYFATPTPGKPNQDGAVGVVADTRFSHNRGFYDEPFDVTITTKTSGAQIRYTTDGSAPTATTGLVYTGPIRIDRTTTLRAAAFKPGYVPTNVDTQSYLFLDDILAQDGSGLPQTWGSSGQSLTSPPGPDYAMDPAVVAANAATIRDDMKSLPVVSLVTNLDYWFGGGGVGIYPQGVAIERPVSFEYFNPDGSSAIQANAGVQIIGGGIGGTSADRWKSYKLSMRVMFKTLYGPGEIQHDIFGPGAADEFDTLVLDAHLNHTWTHPGVDQQQTARYLTDTFVADTQNAMGGYGPHSRFVHLYLNGIYWGMYDLHERPDEHFAQDYFGGNEDDFYVVKHGLQYSLSESVVNGDPTAVSNAYQALLALLNADLTVPANFQQVENVLDIDNFIDYMLANFYAGNEDWTNKNWYATYNPTDPNGKWRFHSWDAEHTLESLGTNVTGTTTTWHPRGIHDLLKRSPEYRMRFADRVQLHFLTPGGTFYVNPASPAWDPAHPENNVPASIYYQRMLEIDRAIVGESARWGDNRRPGNAYTREDWLATQQDMLLNYFPQRTATVLNQLKNTSNNLYPSIAAPAFSQLGGTFSDPYPLSITKSGAGKIYYTTDGSDPRLPGGAINTARAMEYTGPITLWASTRVKARLYDGATWSALTEAAFVIGPPPALRITEVMYHPQPPTNSPYLAEDFEFIEIENTGAAAIDGIFTLAGTIKATFFTPQVLEQGDRIVLVSNPDAFEERYGSSITIAGAFEGRLDNDGGRIILATEFGQVIQNFVYKDAWYPHTDGEGFSLVAIDPNASDATLSAKAGWRASNGLHGAPGQPDAGHNPGVVVINEVLSRPSALDGDWIELHNTTNYDINIGGWFLSNSAGDLERYQIAAGTIIPKQGFLVFTYAQHFGNLADPGSRTAFDLADFGGQRIHLSSNFNGQAGGYRESVDFGTADEDVPFGRHLKSTGAADFVAMSRPTPAEPNAYPLVGPIVINELMYSPPAGADEFIELHNVTGQIVKLYDPDHPQITWRFTDGISFAFAPGDSIPARGYALVVALDPQTFRSKYSIPAQVPIFGPYTKLLENLGEKLELSRPGPLQLDGTVPLIVVDRLHYERVAPWPLDTHGTGASLGRLLPSGYANDPANWFAIADGGNPGLPNTPDAVPPTVAFSPVSPDPRPTAVDLITFAFSEAVDGFDLDRLTLTRNGTPLTIAPGTLTTIDNLSYSLALSDLTWIEGLYELTLDPQGIADLAGNPLATPASVSFAVTGTTVPAAGPADAFYLRLVGDQLEFHHSPLPGDSPIARAPLSQLTVLTLAAGTHRISGNLNGLHVVISGSPTSPTQVALDSGQRWGSLSIVGTGSLDLYSQVLILPDDPGVSDELIGHFKAQRLYSSHASDYATVAISPNDNGMGAPFADTLAGIPVSGADVLLRLTYKGDANFDGVVNADDYFQIDQGYISQKSGWYNGNFNYDQAINADDYFLIDQTFIGQGAPLAQTGQPQAVLAQIDKSSPFNSVLPSSQASGSWVRTVVCDDEGEENGLL